MNSRSHGHRLPWVSSVLLTAVVLVLFVLSGACKQKEKEYAYLFYQAVCPSCEETKRMEELASRVTSLGQRDRRIESRAYDMFHSHTEEITDTIERLCSQHEIEFNSVTLPILFIRNDVFMGEEEISNYLDEIEREQRRD